MTLNFSWVVCALECAPDLEGRQNVVSLIHWRRMAVDQNNVSTDISGSQELIYDDKHPFVPYENLTQNQIIGWVESAMSADEIANLDNILTKQMEEKVNPSVIAPPLPWG